MTGFHPIKFLDEYRDAGLAKGLLRQIEEMAGQLKRPVTFMEICGSHTHALSRFGIRRLLPEKIRLLSGPGCPVCVTSVQDVDKALFLAEQPDVILATFGDMLRVPGSEGRSLQRLRASGADIRVVASPRDVIPLAQGHPDLSLIHI